MTDLEALDDLGAALEPPAGAPATLRRRVMSQTAEAVPPTARRYRRLSVAVGAAAAVAGAVVASQLIPGATGTASAADILKGAASRAQQQPVAQSNQFIYAESAVAALRERWDRPGSGTVERRQRRVWLSVDGTRDGLVRERRKDGTWTSIALPGCRNGSSTVTKGGQRVTIACTPTPAYDRGLPTDPGAMSAYLRQTGAGTKNPADEQAFSAAADLLREGDLAPAVEAAVFHAVAEIPTATKIDGVTDEAGRSGVAVASTGAAGIRTELIFDPATLAYLGERTVLTRDLDGRKAGFVMASSALLRIAVVEQSGQSPH